MTAREYCKAITGKDAGEQLNAGFSVITEAQARKLCAGSLPRPGYEKHFNFHESDPVIRPCCVGVGDYIIARTQHYGGCVWSVRAGHNEYSVR